jgi:hypothetical protein
MKRLISKLFLISFLLTGTISANGQNFPSVKEFLTMNRMNNFQLMTVIKKYGYKKFATIEGTAYWCKNCQVSKDYYPSGVLKCITGCNFKKGVASSISLYRINHRLQISLDVYSKSSFNLLLKQIKALGYRENNESGQGTQSQYWCFSKRGWPKLIIWNDYFNDYSLSVE